MEDEQEKREVLEETSRLIRLNTKLVIVASVVNVLAAILMVLRYIR